MKPPLLIPAALLAAAVPGCQLLPQTPASITDASPTARAILRRT